MAHHGEYAMLIAAANAALVRSMDDGDEHGYKGDWLKQSPMEHYRHLCEHISEILLLHDPDKINEAIDHGIFRFISLKIVRDEGIGVTIIKGH